MKDTRIVSILESKIEKKSYISTKRRVGENDGR